MAVEVFGLYWHFVDIVWIVLFTHIYLILGGRAWKQVRHGRRSGAPSYGVIFLGLVVLTAIELGISCLRVPAPLSTILYLLFSGLKVALVAAFYMHLRDDNRLYTAIFVLPVLLLVVFALLTIAI